MRCHGPENQKAVRRFDGLTGTIKTPDELALWQEILDQLNLGEMPPSPDFRAYYRDNLEVAMRAETETFFRHILDHNLPPRRNPWRRNDVSTIHLACTPSRCSVSKAYNSLGVNRDVY